MGCTRRELASFVPAMLALQAAEKPHTPSQIFVFDDLPVQHTPTLDYRQMITATTVDGCKFSVHESSLAPHSEPHPPHHHNGEEMYLVLEGTLEVTINGKSSQLTRGSVGFVGSGDEHGIRNPTDKPARYYVIELGPQR
jgi:mannose-6-phosphate isomerase-like protein (cupin superfamily)